MYLKHYKLDNDGPIRKLDFSLPFLKVGPYDRHGFPIPVVAVGPSGSGKSIFISRIADALTEIGKYVFDDIVPVKDAYFRLVHANQISSGEKYLSAQMEFVCQDQEIQFIELVGDASLSSDASVFSAWGPTADLTNTKRVGVQQKEPLKADLKWSVLAYFPSNRNEIPNWMNTPGVQREPAFNLRKDFINVLQKPLYVETASEKTKSWILDCAIDSMVLSTSSIRPGEGALLQKVLQIILRDPTAWIKFGYQGFGARIGIQTSKGLLPDIDHLSSAESILLNMFATIIRYGTKYSGISRSTQNTIEGIVLVDEIDAHLHTELQFDVLPKLIALFPRVQFILTTHSPLFLMGMEKQFGEKGVKILELPEGRFISSERFCEFESSFNKYVESKAFEDHLVARLQKGSKPLVCTEGETDANYLNAAIDILGITELKNGIEVDSMGIKGSKGSKGSGSSALNRVKELHNNNPRLFSRQIVLLYDFDEKKSDENESNFFVRSISENPNNKTITKGIENLLPEELFEERFYDIRNTPTGYGKDNIIHTLRKVDLCNWVCSQRKPEHFVNFKPVLETLQKLLLPSN
jgi:hypothetical protein